MFYIRTWCSSFYAWKMFSDSHVTLVPCSYICNFQNAQKTNLKINLLIIPSVTHHTILFSSIGLVIDSNMVSYIARHWRNVGNDERVSNRCKNNTVW